jgi:peptide-methionine (S)-S-oxide reductase
LRRRHRRRQAARKIRGRASKGASYKAAIFVDEDEKEPAEASKAKVSEKLGKPIVTEILPAKPFYPAEGYHQNYYKTNALKYKYYKWSCGRAQRLEEIWGAPESS